MDALQQSSKPTWLAFPRLPGHLSDMLPVADVLGNSFGRSIVFGVLDRRLFAPIAKNNYSVYGVLVGQVIDDLKSVSQRNRIGQKLSAFLDELPNLVDSETHRAMVQCVQLSLKQLLGGVLSTATSVRRAIERFRPEGILVGNPYTFDGRVAAIVANQSGIPVVNIEHGSIFPDDPIWQESPVDLICTWGHPSRRALLTCGVEPHKAIVTGAPRHDEVFRQAELIQRQGSKRQFILVAAGGPGDQVSHAQHKRFVEMLYKAAAATPEVNWVIKLHKRDSLDHYPPAGTKAPGNVSVRKGDFKKDGTEIFDYLLRARAVVTVFSTVASEAMALGVPVVSVNVWHPGQAIKGVEFLDRGCTHQVKNEVELADAVRTLWNGTVNSQVAESARDYASEHFVNRGHAASAVAQAMMNLVETHRRA